MCMVNFTFCKSDSVISVKKVKHLPKVKVGNGRPSSPDFLFHESSPFFLAALSKEAFRGYSVFSDKAQL